MIGSRATSGSVATTLRNVVIACSASSRSASIFTSRMLAPPRTCSSAISTAPGEVVRLDEPAKARRAGHVRALADEDEAGVGTDLEPFEPAEARTPPRLGDRPRGEPATAAAIACVCSGVVPQQPPTTFTSPLSANSRGYRLVSCACSS